MQQLPRIRPDRVESWVTDNLAGLFGGPARRSNSFTGGQTPADRALASLDIGGYSKQRSTVEPRAARGATRLSPYIRHGLLDLPTVHDHRAVAEANSYDRFRYRGELLWQEYSRHWYAAFGSQTRHPTVYKPQPAASATTWSRAPWPDDMNCVASTVTELHDDGWMVNQTRMWLASQWAVRSGAEWRDGEDEMFRHLLDGSRAANRQGWQWVVGATRNRSYGFSRRQVLKQAPQLCENCELREACPIGGYPGSVAGDLRDPTPTMSTDAFGALADSPPSLFGMGDTDNANEADAVWVTAESLGDNDPALAAHPDLPVHFVFDEPLLERLQLNGKRLVFLADCLSELSARRQLTIWRGRPIDLLRGEHDAVDGRTFAATAAPVPGFADIVARLDQPIRLEPWRWLRPPTPRLIDRLHAKRFPSFKDWCQITKPAIAPGR